MLSAREYNSAIRAILPVLCQGQHAEASRAASVLISEQPTDNEGRLRNGSSDGAPSVRI